MMMAPRVLVFQHASYCPLGTFGDELAADGITPVIVKFHDGDAIPPLEDFDALLTLGGSMDVWQEDTHPWLVREKAAIRAWVRNYDKPYLGICLGHQLLADALGGKVLPARTVEAFIIDVPVDEALRDHPLFKGFAQTKRALQWHASEVQQLPREAKLLVSTPGCAVTVFSAGSAAFGVQYHPEVDVELVDLWCTRPAVQSLIESVHGPEAVSIVHADMLREKDELRANAARLYRNFMSIVEDRISQTAE
jgi:GMP synthase-like glutamine amidotransferase